MTRRPSVLTVLALALLSLGASAFAPAVEAPTASSASSAEREIVVCVRFRDYTVPMTDITYEPPSERFCVETPDVQVPFPGGNPAPDHLPGDDA